MKARQSQPVKKGAIVMQESLKLLLGIACAALVVAAAPASSSVFVSVDEYGNGFAVGDSAGGRLVGVLAPDPGPGGLPSVLTYNLPSWLAPGDLVPGDLLITEHGRLGDVLRFNASGTASLLVYSGFSAGGASLGDTTSPPLAFYPNTVTRPEGDLWADEPSPQGVYYTPQQGMPGYFAGLVIQYRFMSDDIPEATTWAMMLLGFAGLSYAGRRTLRKTVPIAD
jgi:hypothetical protein